MSLDSRTVTLYRLICNGCEKATIERTSFYDTLEESRKEGWTVKTMSFEALCPECTKKVLEPITTGKD